MIVCVAKSTSINLRITPEFRAEIEELASYHGLSMSSYAHSLLVKGVRRERQELFGEVPKVKQSERAVNGIKLAPRSKNKIPLLNRPKEQPKRKTG
jgi:hypothetical protein